MKPATIWRPLIEALCALLPGATIESITERDWHSATFAGRQLQINMRLGGGDAESRAVRLGKMLPEHTFALPRHFVAEIALKDVSKDAAGVRIFIEALLLEE